MLNSSPVTTCSHAGSLKRVFVTRRPRVRRLQQKYRCVGHVNDVTTRKVAENSDLAKSKTDIEDFVGRVDRLVDIQGVRGRRGAYPL